MEGSLAKEIRVFLFFSNKLGWVGSILVSVVVSLVLLLVFRFIF
jgi:hypothetical protein